MVDRKPACQLGKPLWVTIYPGACSIPRKFRRYAESLDVRFISGHQGFFKQQAARYGRQLENPLLFRWHVL